MGMTNEELTEFDRLANCQPDFLPICSDCWLRSTCATHKSFYESDAEILVCSQCGTYDKCDGRLDIDPLVSDLRKAVRELVKRVREFEDTDVAKNVLDLVHEIKTVKDVGMCSNLIGLYVLAQRTVAVRSFKEKFGNASGRLRLLADWLNKVCMKDTDPEVQVDLRTWADLLGDKK